VPTTNRDPTWPLPDSPAHPFYADVLARYAKGEDDLFRATCENDFWFFVRHCLTVGELLCDDPHLEEHYQKNWFDHRWLFARCRDLQAAPNGFLDLWGRFHFKTCLITQSMPQWDLIDQPDLRFGIITYRIDQAGTSLTWQIKREAEINHKLKKHWPHVYFQNPQQESPQWTQHELCFRRALNPKDPSISLSSLRTGMTSSHLHTRIWDDCVTREAVRSREAIEQTTERWRQFSGTAADYVYDRATGTHWAVNDTYRSLLDDDLFTLRHHDVFESDGVTPVLRSKHWVEQRFKEMGPEHFACVMRNMPMQGALQNFKIDWLRYYNEEPDSLRKNNLNVYLFIDTANAKKENDYTVITVIGLGRGVPTGNYYVLDIVRDRMGMVTMTDKLFELVEKWRPNHSFIERVGAARDIEYIQERQRAVGTTFPISEVYERLPKVERITRLQGLFRDGRMYLPQRIQGRMDGRVVDLVRVFRDFEYQFWKPGGGGSKHDDMLDCMSWVVSPAVKHILSFPDRIEGSVATLQGWQLNRSRSWPNADRKQNIARSWAV
jgi:predicted phage terminase large subunit-like protein